MIKNKEMIKFIKLVNDTFGASSFVMRDYWGGSNEIGFQKDNKLMYIAIYDPDDYFYESELLLDDPGKQSIVESRGNQVSKEQVIEAINKFFEINKKL